MAEFFAEMRTGAERDASRARVLGARRPAGAARRARPCWPSACAPATAPSARSTPSRSRCRSRSRPRSARTTTPTRERLYERLRRARALGRHRARRALDQAGACCVPSFTRLGHPVRAARAAARPTLELASFTYFNALPDGDAPLAFHFSGSVFYAGGQDRHAADPGALGTPRRSTGCRSRPGARRSPSTTRRAATCTVRRDAEALRQLRSRARATSRSTPCWPTCCDGARRSVNTQLEALVTSLLLRGLRALPVHARGGEERDAHAVRDRLPVLLRRRRRTTPTTSCRSSAGSRAAGAALSAEVRFLRARRASATRRCRGGWSSTAPARRSSTFGALTRAGVARAHAAIACTRGWRT